MSSSLRFSNRESRNNKKYLQPPALNSFDLFSSQDKEERFEEEIQELSNVEEKSYFESEPELPDQLDIEDFLGKMKEIDEKELTPSNNPRRSQRLEDQEIIVVQEENQVGSNLGGNESVILEHIEFGHDDHPENTPEWENEDEGVKKGDEMHYVINYISENSPAWIAKDNESISSSTPYDIESSEFKISHNRNSKNTCIDRLEQMDSEKNLVNKSCIQKPILFDEPDTKKNNYKFPINQKTKSKNIQDILNKWNDQIYPRLQNQYLDSDTNLIRRVSADFQMERDAKFCHSKYKEQSSQGNASRTSRMDDADSIIEQDKSRTSIMKKRQEEVQTDLSGQEILHNEKYLAQELSQLKNRNIKLQDQLSKTKQKLAFEHSELIKARQSLKNKDYELQNLKSSYRLTQEQSLQEKKWGQQSKRLSLKNKELERLVNKQNEQLRQYEQINEALSKKMHKTVSYNTFFSSPQERSPTFFGGNEYQSVKLNKLQTFGLEEQNSHEKCRKQIEQLQQYIFDLQQKFAGIDIEVERRVRLITQTIQNEITLKIAQQSKQAINILKQQVSKYKQAYRLLEYKNRQHEEKYEKREQELNEREKEVNRMYEELVKEWKEVEKESEVDKKNAIKNVGRTKESYSPRVIGKAKLDNPRTTNYTVYDAQLNSLEAPSYCYFSSKELKTPNFNRERTSFSKKNAENNNSVSYIIPQDTSFRKASNKLNQTEKYSYNFTKLLGDEGKWERRQLSNNQIRQKSELTAINNKIQRLRKEINKQLCSIH